MTVFRTAGRNDSKKKSVSFAGNALFSRLVVDHDPIAALVLKRGEGRALLEIGLFIIVAVAVLVVCLVVAGHGNGLAGSEFLHSFFLPINILYKKSGLIPIKYVFLVKIQNSSLIS